MAHDGHECRAIDLPGHGARTGERFTFAGALAAIGEAVESCTEPPLLVGISLGGYASLAFAAENDGRVCGVVLSGCSTEIRGMPLRAYSVLSTVIAELVTPGGGTWHLVTDVLAAMTGYSALADLRRLRVPVWLVNGRRDLMRLSERRYLAALPGTRLDVVRRAGHDVHCHTPTAFNRILLRVVDELTALARVPAAALGA
jgi:pimeloyl-ACP methyl ester carboxylesterase